MCYPQYRELIDDVYLTVVVLILTVTCRRSSIIIDSPLTFFVQEPNCSLFIVPLIIIRTLSSLSEPIF